MRSVPFAAALLLVVASCRGEKTPRDYQNIPPAATHPATSSSATPTAHGMPGPAAEPTAGAEGQAAPYKTINPVPPAATTDTQAVTDTQHATQTAATATTGTHLATPP
jgi:hypothetical protein